MIKLLLRIFILTCLIVGAMKGYEYLKDNGGLVRVFEQSGIKKTADKLWRGK